MSETRTMPVFTSEERELLRQAVDVICAVAQQQGIEVVQIYLFGSRARGDAQPDSDWDFYVVIDKEAEFPQRQRLASQIRRYLARQKIACDVLVQGRETVSRRAEETGYLTYYALKEGVSVYERNGGQELDAKGG